MKKKELKKLKIVKKTISTFDKQKIKGGLGTSQLEFSFCCTVNKH
ncbi:MAG: hypothetical protein AAF617_05125 [Bacteroidota bacterium]